MGLVILPGELGLFRLCCRQLGRHMSEAAITLLGLRLFGLSLLGRLGLRLLLSLLSGLRRVDWVCYGLDDWFNDGFGCGFAHTETLRPEIT